MRRTVKRNREQIALSKTVRIQYPDHASLLGGKTLKRSGSSIEVAK